MSVVANGPVVGLIDLGEGVRDCANAHLANERHDILGVDASFLHVPQGHTRLPVEVPSIRLEARPGYGPRNGLLHRQGDCDQRAKATIS